MMEKEKDMRRVKITQMECDAVKLLLERGNETKIIARVLKRNETTINRIKKAEFLEEKYRENSRESFKKSDMEKIEEEKIEISKGQLTTLIKTMQIIDEIFQKKGIKHVNFGGDE